MKTRKTKGFPKYMTINMNYDKNMFKFIFNYRTWKQKTRTLNMENKNANEILFR
jgi:hypothetical protein